MKIAIMESVVTPGGHEIDYDRILVEELTALGHEVEFYVPEGHAFKWNYGVPVNYLKGAGISYQGAKGIKKLWLSAKREYNRQIWYKQLYRYASDGCFDALIFPSATYRYLRALRPSILLKSPVPVLFVIHGLTPAETKRLANQIQKFGGNRNIRVAVQSFAKEKLHNSLPGVKFLLPPNYIPRDVDYVPQNSLPQTIKLGFFGQYRKEKNLDSLLDVYSSCRFQRPVKLIVQGSTNSAEDAADFERIIKKYQDSANAIEFQHRPLIGREWQEAISKVDALVMPYGTERYRYHTSAMLSTAIGFYKPVIIADIINPEVIHDYGIGIAFPAGDTEKLRQVLEEFVNTFDEKAASYQQELTRANKDFSPRKLALGLVEMAQGRGRSCEH